MSEGTGSRKKIRIGDLLVQHRKISEQQLAEALEEQRRTGHKLGRTLVQLGHISEDEFLDFLAHQLDVPRVDLKHFQFRPEVVRELPEKHARRYRALVLSDRGDDLLIGMADPTDLFAFDELRRLLQRPLSVALVQEAQLVRAIDTVYRRTEEITTLAEEVVSDLSEGDYDLADLDESSNDDDAPVIRLLRSMFEDAVQVKASDIHIEPGEAVVRIRQRIDGVLQEQIIEGRRVASALVTRLKLMARLNISEKRMPQDGRFSIRVKERRIDVRLSTMPIQYGESVVMRLLDQSAGQLDFDALGMPADVQSRLRHWMQSLTGMVIVTGPTGSGKTTTLYSCLDWVNTPGRKIITVEDPVEYRLPRINQVQVNPRIGLDFARVLRTGLRQDPDIVMIGEMRDHETVEIGLRAAMTGHLVLSTLHTNSAIDAVVRLMDIGARGYMLASSVSVVIAQRLIRRVCESCADTDTPTRQQRAWLTSVLGEDEFQNARFRKGRGCNYCSNTGYRGRIGVFELLEIDQELGELLKRADGADFAAAARRRAGYRPLLASALEHLVAGVTSIEDLLRLAGGLDVVTDMDNTEIPDPDLTMLRRSADPGDGPEASGSSDEPGDRANHEPDHNPDHNPDQNPDHDPNHEPDERLDAGDEAPARPALSLATDNDEDEDIDEDEGRSRSGSDRAPSLDPADEPTLTSDAASISNEDPDTSLMEFASTPRRGKPDADRDRDSQPRPKSDEDEA